MEKAIIYVRRSTDMQEASLDDQRKSIQDYAKQNGFGVVREFCDDAISGKTVQARPGFQSMIEFARNNGEEQYTLLVYDVSRFGRFENPKEATYWEVELERHGVKVHYITEGLTNDGSLGSYITKVVKDAEASEYIKKLSKLTKRGIQSCAERGYWTTGVAPYGYNRAVVEPSTGTIETVLEIGQRRALKGKRIKLVHGNEDHVRTVQLIFDLYANREQGLMSIADYLNRQEIPNPSGKKHWHKSTLRNVLRNPAYIGVVSLHRDEPGTVKTEQAHEPLITPDVFEKAQKRLNDAQFGKRGGYTTRYLLTALVECLQCGNNLHGATDKAKNRYGYRCTGYTAKGKYVCNSPYYTASVLEEPVLTYMQSQIQSSTWPDSVKHAIAIAIGQDEHNIATLLENHRGEYEQNKVRMQNLLSAIADGLPRNKAIQAVQELEQRQDTLEETLNKLEADQNMSAQYNQFSEKLLKLPTYWDDLFTNATPQEKKQIVRAFLDSAQINHTDNVITYNFYQWPKLTETHKPETILTVQKITTVQRKKSNITSEPVSSLTITSEPSLPLIKDTKKPLIQRTLFD